MQTTFDAELAKSNVEKHQKHNKLYWILFGIFLLLTIIAGAFVFHFQTETASIVSMCACIILAFIAYICHTSLTKPTVEMEYNRLLNDPDLEILQIKLQHPAANEEFCQVRYVWAITANKEGDVQQHLLGDVKAVRNTKITEETLDLNKCVLYIPYQYPKA